VSNSANGSANNDKNSRTDNLKLNESASLKHSPAGFGQPKRSILELLLVKPLDLYRFSNKLTLFIYLVTHKIEKDNKD
jgi:hypothetical protein